MKNCHLAILRNGRWQSLRRLCSYPQTPKGAQTSPEAVMRSGAKGVAPSTTHGTILS